MAYRQVEKIVTVITAFSVIIILLQYMFSLSKTQMNLVYIFDFVVVFILAADFLYRLKQSKEGFSFLVKYWYEIPAMLPLILFSIVENEAGQSLAAVIRLMRLFRILHLFFRILRAVEGKDKIVYIIIFSFASITIGAIAEYLIESPQPDAKITNLGDAFWWAMATVTTVGYGDVFPVTTEGRIVGAVLMLVGISILGIFISTLGTMLIENRLSSRVIAYNVKKTLKERIDILEEIHEPEVESLVDEIRILHKKIYKGSSICNRCGFLYPEESVFCNRCGSKIRG